MDTLKKIIIVVLLNFVVCISAKSQQKIAVLDFIASVGVEQRDVDGISAIFSTYFVDPDKFILIERSQFKKIIDEQRLQQSDLTESKMVELGRLLNLHRIVVGNVNIINHQYNVDIRVVDVQSGSVIATDGATWTSQESYRDLMRKLAERIKTKIPDYTPLVSKTKEYKFGVVNAQSIFDAMPERAIAQTQFETASKTYEDKFKKLADELNKKYTEFQNLPTYTSEAIKQRYVKELQEMEQNIQRFRTTAQQDLQHQNEQLMAPIQQKIETAIKAVGTENGFTFIFPEGVPPVYLDIDVFLQDVTPLVKTKLGIQ